MTALRHQQIEHEILKLVLKHSDHLGHSTDLSILAGTLRQIFPDIENRELVDTLKRLQPRYLALWKYSKELGRHIQYPTEIGDDEEFFYKDCFRLSRTPETDPYCQQLAELIRPLTAPSGIGRLIEDVSRTASFQHWQDTVMPYRPLSSLIPTVDELLQIDMPALGGVLLRHLKSYEGAAGNSVYQNGLISQTNWLAIQEASGHGPLRKEPEYGNRQPEVNRALIEAWNWLGREGILIRDPRQPAPWFSISRSGEELLRRLDRHERWEKLGLDQVKADLEHSGGRRVVGGGPGVADQAWEWVRMKEGRKIPESGTDAVKPAQHSRKVFVVHGHDEAAREMIARFLEQIGFVPIILHEQASRGRTVIEKVEAHGDVGFAVVLLTPDDEGCEKGATLRPRARQNVVLELGYFLGRLGRTHVCALKRGDPEIPSDFEGVVYVTFDHSNGWKQALGKELEAAGFTIDWNKAMGARA